MSREAWLDKGAVLMRGVLAVAGVRDSRKAEEMIEGLLFPVQEE